MWTRHLGLVFLLWFPDVLYAQSEGLPCTKPKLDDGYYFPAEEMYAHDRELSYSCNNGHKPVAEGWWATSRCQNGTWTPQPQCIDDNACNAPIIPNAKFTKPPAPWYKVGTTVRIRCDKGYEPQNQTVTARCQDGAWTTLPICEKSLLTCSEPPKIPNAVIIRQGYQNVFAVDSTVQYECKNGFTPQEGDTKLKIVCLSGKWTDATNCTKERPGSKQDGSVVRVAGTEQATSAGQGTQARGRHPDTGHGGSAGGHTTSAGRETQVGGGGRHPDTGSGSAGGHTTSTGRETQVGGGGRHPDTAYGGSAGGHTTSTGRGTQPGGGGRHPDTGHGGSAGGHTTSAGRETQVGGGGRHPDTGSGSAGGHTTSTGRETQVGGGGRHPDTAYGGSAGGHTTSTGRGTQPGGGGRHPDTGHGGSAGGHTTSAGRETQVGGGGRHPDTGSGSAGGHTTSTGRETQVGGRHPDTGYSGSAGGHTTSTGRGTQVGGRDPDTGSDGSAGGHTTSTGRGTQGGGGGRDPDTGHGGSAGGLTTSTGGGASSTSSGSKEGEVELRRVAINNCGAPPRVENGDVVQTQSMFLKYQCIDFYSLEGSDRVACYSNGQWSDVPTCRATYCSVDTDADRRFESVGVQFLRDGEEVPLECKKKRWTPNRWSMVRCTDTTLTFSDCCLWASIKVGNC
ncbi:protein lingerer-like isoform X10 [Anabas testudineus]|uniref:protein lingerer-like isoform X10 n=1 Tax=Anabas testudineus TaxID=64144 RepID=UPI000E453B7A|nr:protein lingerer-like isoform X10 [Anabas testudineus]